MKKIMLSALAMVVSVTANAEVVTCNGFTDADQKTKVTLTLYPLKKKGEIRFVTSGGSSALFNGAPLLIQFQRSRFSSVVKVPRFGIVCSTKTEV